MNIETGPLLSLVLTIVSAVVTMLLRNSKWVTRGVDERVNETVKTTSSTGNGFSVVAASAFESQTQTMRLLMQRMDEMQAYNTRQFDAILLKLIESNKKTTDRIDALETKWHGELHNVSHRVRVIEQRLNKDDMPEDK
ncbi:MAG: hypothetical protein KC496_04745 [Anaerolineae bacterium]|nr:hypothetical protein [Anaerolineae bacterium]